jgi:hypothetical protein
MVRADRLKLLLLMGLFAAPGLAAWLVRDHWRPTATASHGELLEPFIPALGDAGLKGHWVLLTVAGRECDAACRRQLYLSRQVRIAQGREQERVERALLRPPGAAPVDEPGLRHLVLPEAGLPPWQAGGGTRTYVMDPLGRVMLRFPAEPDGKGMIRDLGRLLKASAIG